MESKMLHSPSYRYPSSSGYLNYFIKMEKKIHLTEHFNCRERKNTYYSNSEEREESLELEPGTGERRKSGVPTLTEGSGWQMGSRQFVAGNEIAWVEKRQSSFFCIFLHNNKYHKNNLNTWNNYKKKVKAPCFVCCLSCQGKVSSLLSRSTSRKFIKWDQVLFV